ncbi:MAG: S8 family peptidase, partial [Candidatus Bipolaricaulia bacterium]
MKLSFEWLPWGVDRIDAEVVHHPPRELLALHNIQSAVESPLPLGERREVRGTVAITPIPTFPPQGGRRRDDGSLLLMLLLFLLLGLIRRNHLRSLLLVSLALSILTIFLTGCDLINIRVHPGTQGPEGEGVRVALLDSGIDPDHLDLKANYRGGYDFVNHDPFPWDDNGHGTEVAGVLAARENGVGLIGVAPRAELFAVKVLGQDARGAISDVAKGLEWAIEHGIRVVNMSLGTPEDSQVLREAVRAAWEAGLVLIAPAGNESGRVLYPAAYSEVIAVAATDKDDKLAWFSNTGPQVELAAPGEEIPTTYPGNRYRLA